MAILAHVAPAQHEHATQGKFDPLSNPNEAVAEYYSKNKAEIDQLASVAKNETAAEQQRVDALTKLQRKYPDPAVAISTELVQDKSSAVAATAVGIVANAAVMMNHKSPTSDAPTPNAAYQMSKHVSVMDALRSAVVDDREEVRKPAAQLLAAQSDAIGLQQIAKSVEKGICSDLEAVRYLGLADASKSGPYLAPYLEHGSEEVQAAAAGRLAYAPEYKTLVRDKVLLNPTAKLQVRKAAAMGLAADANTTLTLLADPSTPSELYGEVLQGYLKDRGDRLSPEQLESLQRGVESVQQRQPDAKLDDVKENLKQLHQSKSK